MATFYYNKSDKRYANKTLEVVYDDVELTYIDSTNIMRPILKLGKAIDPLSFNYVYIPEFKRYYFVEKPPTFENGFYRVELKTDTLVSFKEYYKNQNVIVARNEYLFNMYLDDQKYKVQNRTAVRTVVFPSGFMGHNIVLGVVGKNSE